MGLQLRNFQPVLTGSAARTLCVHSICSLWPVFSEFFWLKASQPPCPSLQFQIWGVRATLGAVTYSGSHCSKAPLNTHLMQGSALGTTRAQGWACHAVDHGVCKPSRCYLAPQCTRTKVISQCILRKTPSLGLYIEAGGGMDPLL